MDIYHNNTDLQALAPLEIASLRITFYFAGIMAAWHQFQNDQLLVGTAENKYPVQQQEEFELEETEFR